MKRFAVKLSSTAEYTNSVSPTADLIIWDRKYSEWVLADSIEGLDSLIEIAKEWNAEEPCHLVLVKCETTEEERFKARMKRWNMKGKKV